MLVFYSQNYHASKVEFDTLTKSARIAKRIRAERTDDVRLKAPHPATFPQLIAVHDFAYVDAVRKGRPRELAESNGFAWDPGVYTSAIWSTGGVIAAAMEAYHNQTVAGSLSSGLHHAKTHSGSGFCTFNGLVVAAQALLESGAKRIVILDFDAHYGDGTVQMIRENGLEKFVFPIDVSTHPFGGSVERYDTDFRDAIERAIAAEPDIVIYNAGMDPHERCRIGGQPGITEALLMHREKDVFRAFSTRQIPVAFVLAGGYAGPQLHEDEVTSLHMLTVRIAARFAFNYEEGKVV